MIIKAHANYRPYAVAVAQNLLLDDYPNAAAAYSLRKLDKDYAGSCIRIRRTSDNAETDIGFINNYVDTNEIKTFATTSQARIVTFYDQSGNGRNANQSVAANQPIIYSNSFLSTITGTNSDVRKSISFEGDQRLISNFSTISQPISVFTFVRKDNVTTHLAGTIYDSYNSTQSILYYTGTTDATNNRWTLAAGAGLQGTTAGTTNPSIFSTLHNSTSSSIHINGQSYVSGNAGTNGLNGLSIGNIRGNPSPIAAGYVLNGRISEMIIYGSNQSSNRTGIENNINDYYNIYWNGDFTGILDDYPSSAAAYSLRNLDKDYTGPLVRVRRSNDNAEQDIFGDYYGNLDTVGLKNFVGAGNNGFVTVWYDQSSSNKNIFNTTAAQQPTIIDLGTIQRQNNKPCIVFGGGGTNQFIKNDTMKLPLINRSVFFVMRQLSIRNFGDEGFFGLNPPSGSNDFNTTSAYEFQGQNPGASRQYGAFGSAGVSYQLQKNGTSNVSLQILTPYSLLSEIKGGSSASLYENGNLITTDNSFTEFINSC